MHSTTTISIWSDNTCIHEHLNGWYGDLIWSGFPLAMVNRERLKDHLNNWQQNSGLSVNNYLKYEWLTVFHVINMGVTIKSEPDKVQKQPNI